MHTHAHTYHLVPQIQYILGFFGANAGLLANFLLLPAFSRLELHFSYLSMKLLEFLPIRDVNKHTLCGLDTHTKFTLQYSTTFIAVPLAFILLSQQGELTQISFCWLGMHTHFYLSPATLTIAYLEWSWVHKVVLKCSWDLLTSVMETEELL